ncbi:unnamed protein product [Linum tenue]|uniref:Uncharacterized protein n=1 Tax=Linum tenue TaxID=586396 RepID=A0AAV0NYB2_9ROSI|nr:unnamed protein product [Linum tenue]
MLHLKFCKEIILRRLIYGVLVSYYTRFWLVLFHFKVTP